MNIFKKNWEVVVLMLMTLLDASYHWADVLKVWDNYFLYPHFPLLGFITYNLFWTTYWTFAFLLTIKLIIKINRKLK
jgi:hypothetical protein